MTKIEELDRLLFCEETINDKLEEIKEAFINFYGEDLRDEIEEKFRYCKIVPYRNKFDNNSLISEIKYNATIEIIKRYIKDNSKLEITDLLNYGESFDFDIKFKKFVNFYNALNKKDTKKEDLDRLFDEVSLFLSKYIKGITLSNYHEYESDEIIQELESLAAKYPIMLSEYNEFTSKYSKIIEEIEEDERIENDLLRKYNHELLSGFIDIFPSPIQTRIKEYLNSNASELPHSLSKVFGNGILPSGAIYKFIRPVEILQEYEKDMMLEYFRLCGISIEKNEDYKSNMDALSLIPMSFQIEALEQKAKSLYAKYEEEKLNLSNNYKKKRKELDELQLCNKDDGFDNILFSTNTTCTEPNAILKNGEYKLFTLIFFKSMHYNDLNTLDHNLIHELNHMLESFLIDADEDGCITMCGWEYRNSTKVTNEENSNNARKYELFNEIINELITMEIYRNMREKGVFIFGDNNNEEKMSSYLEMEFLVKEFYETYKDAIIESRRNGNIQILFNKVGKENFESLNSLFKYFKLGGFNRDKIEISKEDKLKVIEERDKILERMAQYNKLNNSTNNAQNKSHK